MQVLHVCDKWVGLALPRLANKPANSRSRSGAGAEPVSRWAPSCEPASHGSKLNVAAWSWLTVDSYWLDCQSPYSHPEIHFRSHISSFDSLKPLSCSGLCFYQKLHGYLICVSKYFPAKNTPTTFNQLAFWDCIQITGQFERILPCHYGIQTLLHVTTLCHVTHVITSGNITMSVHSIC